MTPAIVPAAESYRLPDSRLRRGPQDRRGLHLTPPGSAPTEPPPPVIAPGLIVKADQFPGVHRKDLQQGDDAQPLIEGAPNFRKLDTGLYGLAQPTIDAARRVLEAAGGGPVTWLSLREEPVIYVDGTPYNLRAEAHPFDNLEAPGRTTAEVEALERRLKAELLERGRSNRGLVTLYEEAANGALVPRQVKVGPHNVRTVREVFDGLRAEGYPVTFERIPVTDEQGPEPQDLDAMVAAVARLPKSGTIIANCHAGRGRTTTALVTAALLRGSGELDALIDRFGQVVNLREQIAYFAQRAAKADDPKRRLAAQTRSDGFVRRYQTLAAFERYVAEEGPSFARSFSAWLIAAEAAPEPAAAPQW